MLSSKIFTLALLKTLNRNILCKSLSCDHLNIGIHRLVHCVNLYIKWVFLRLLKGYRDISLFFLNFFFIFFTKIKKIA